MTCYLDSSVAVHILLGTSEPARRWFDQATAQDGVISSRILRTELTRVLRREGLDVAIRDEILDHIGTIPLGPATLLQAESITAHLKTFDAIHLGSAIYAGLDDLVVITHDAAMQQVAAQLGFPVEDPVVG